MHAYPKGSYGEPWMYWVRFIKMMCNFKRTQHYTYKVCVPVQYVYTIFFLQIYLVYFTILQGPKLATRTWRRRPEYNTPVAATLLPCIEVYRAYIPMYGTKLISNSIFYLFCWYCLFSSLIMPHLSLWPLCFIFQSIIWCSLQQ